MVETTSQAAVQALLVLFSRPDALARAAAAATADDDDALADLVFEALRFRPINPMVVRVAKEDYHLAAGEPHETLIRKGTTVFALTWSAMFDPRVLDAPEEFRPGRPDYHYLHFATGLHACYGRYISRIQIPQILKPLLKLKGLRPVGAPEYDGTFPETFRSRPRSDAPHLPVTESVGLEVFQQRHAVGLGQVRAPEVAAIAVAGPRGVDEAVLLVAGRIDGEAELYRVILARAERKRLGPLVRGKQQVVQRRDRSVVQVGCRGPDPVERSRRVGTVGRLSVEQRVAPGDASASVEVLHHPLLRRVDSGRRVGLLLDAVHGGLNGPGEGSAVEGACRP